ncbi:MAG: ATP-binding cassette domain-containing protein [Acidobacteriota bacterium]
MRIEIRGLNQVYPGGFQALHDVELAVDRGLTGLLGPNGAGKTTLMNVVATLLEPTQGQVLVDGQPLGEDRNQIRARLGYLPQDWGAPRSARCSEVLDLMLNLRGVKAKSDRREAIKQALEWVNLADLGKRKVKTLSGGQLRRLGVAQALVGDPELIILDEPTVGMDPDERVQFRRLLSQLGTERTIILSTHVVPDIGSSCEQVVVLDQGRRAFQGRPEEFVKKADGKVFECLLPSGDESQLPAGLTVVSHQPSADGTIYRLVGEPAPDHGLELTPVEPGLEEAYLCQVGQAAFDELAASAA